MSKEAKPQLPRFLIEIKAKKEVVYSVTLGMQNKETAQQWGEKWIEKNHRGSDHKVSVTEVLVDESEGEGEGAVAASAPVDTKPTKKDEKKIKSR